MYKTKEEQAIRGPVTVLNQISQLAPLRVGNARYIEGKILPPSTHEYCGWLMDVLLNSLEDILTTVR